MKTEIFPRPLTIEAAGLSHAGKVQATNQDHFAILTIQKSVRFRATNLVDTSVLDGRGGPEVNIFIVADGMGARSGGKLASGLAVSSVVEYLAEAIDCVQDYDFGQETAFLDTLSTAVWQGHERIMKRFPSGAKAATTLTMVTLVWPRAYVIHAGDSRAYVLRKGVLKRLTRDQTLGDDLVDRGGITERLAKDAGLYSIPSSQLGAEFLPRTGVVDLSPQDRLLLCTDGLTRLVPDERIAALVAGDSPTSVVRSLVDAALEAGGSDNVTVVAAWAAVP